MIFTVLLKIHYNLYYIMNDQDFLNSLSGEDPDILKEKKIKLNITSGGGININYDNVKYKDPRIDIGFLDNKFISGGGITVNLKKQKLKDVLNQLINS